MTAMTCANCPSPSTVRVAYYSDSIEPAEKDLCDQCTFDLHQEMLGHIMWLHVNIEERPLEEVSA